MANWDDDDDAPPERLHRPPISDRDRKRNALAESQAKGIAAIATLVVVILIVIILLTQKGG